MRGNFIFPTTGFTIVGNEYIQDVINSNISSNEQKFLAIRMVYISYSPLTAITFVVQLKNDICIRSIIKLFCG